MQAPSPPAPLPRSGGEGGIHIRTEIMSTATAPPPAPVFNAEKRADLQRKCNDPLERLRGTIKLYVSAEGAAVLVMYLALWFWIGLAIDYGFFKLFTVDWVEALQGYKGLRVAVLIILIAGLLAV